MYKHGQVYSNYLHSGLNINDRKTVIRLTLEKMRQSLDVSRIQAIAVCGYSGLLIGPAIADILDIPLILVRKTIEGSHSNELVEGALGARNYVIIDDFIDTGNTIDHIITSIAQCKEKHGYKSGKLMAVVLWRSNPSDCQISRLRKQNIIGKHTPVF